MTILIGDIMITQPVNSEEAYVQKDPSPCGQFSVSLFLLVMIYIYIYIMYIYIYYVHIYILCTYIHIYIFLNPFAYIASSAHFFHELAGHIGDHSVGWLQQQ